MPVSHTHTLYCRGTKMLLFTHVTMYQCKYKQQEGFSLVLPTYPAWASMHQGLDHVNLRLSYSLVACLSPANMGTKSQAGAGISGDCISVPGTS